jgi:phytanoyl-CoA hydroxylase
MTAVSTIRSTLSSEQVNQFAREGYLILRSLASESQVHEMLNVSMQHLHAQIEPIEYEAEVGYPGAPASLDAPGGRTARRLRNAWQRHECFRRWAADPALVAMLRTLLNEPVCISLAHHNCVMTKHPQYGTATGWHRDIRYWSFTRPDLISVWLALGEEQAGNGGLSFLPGTHRLPIQREQMDALDFLRPEHSANQQLFARSESPTLQAGDVVLFHSGLFHAAGINRSDHVKASVVFAYRAQSNLPLPGSKSATAGDIALA